MLRRRHAIAETESYLLEDAHTAVIAYGFSARTGLYAVKRLREEGVKAGLLRLSTLWPFPEERVREVTAAVKRVLVPEMNRGQVAGEVRKYAPCEVVSLCQTNGEIISPGTMLDHLRRISV